MDESQKACSKFFKSHCYPTILLDLKPEVFDQSSLLILFPIDITFLCFVRSRGDTTDALTAPDVLSYLLGAIAFVGKNDCTLQLDLLQKWDSHLGVMDIA